MPRLTFQQPVMRLVVGRRFHFLSPARALARTSNSRRPFSTGMFGDGVGKKDRSPLEIYNYLVRKHRLRADDHQRQVVGKLDCLHKEMLTYKVVESPQAQAAALEKSSSFFGSFFGTKKAEEPAVASVRIDPSVPRGVYLWGKPGCGKTVLMDLAFRCGTGPAALKRRTHFNSFMLDIHRRIFEWRKSTGGKDGDPIPVLASQLVQESRLLCFDEFQVTDVADAMVLKYLFQELFKRGVVVVATSNRPPDNLYENGIQRELFLPFIDLLKQQCEVIELHSGIDYRTRGTYLKETYFSPLDDAAKGALEASFERTLNGAAPAPESVTVAFGRELVVPQAANGVARFTFKELCQTNLGPSDYMSLVANFHTVFITDIPQLSPNDLNSVNRFIKCIDELYQGRLRTVISADAPPERLFSGEGGFEEVFAFSRCLSRLQEMQSKEYLENAKSNKIEC